MRPIFIGGCPRSGTTFLASMLGAHPDYLAIPETGFKPAILARADPVSAIDGAETLSRLSGTYRFVDWESSVGANGIPAAPTAREFMEWLVVRWGQQTGKPSPRVWIDHSPENMRDARLLSRHFPDARLVHIVRDGRGIAASFRGIEGWGENEIEPAARTWVNWMAHGFAAELSGDVLPVARVRYEDLVSDTGTALKRLCASLELDYTPTMHDGSGFEVSSRLHETSHRLIGRPPQRSRADAWRRVLSQREIERFEAMAQNLLTSLGYQPDFGPAARPATTAERRISTVRGFARRRWVLLRRNARGHLNELRSRSGPEESR